jgi:probable phosphoglycerate mutase
MTVKDDQVFRMSDATSKETTTYVLLIRHGENDWVGTDRLAGRTPGVQLNEKGHVQAQALVRLLERQPLAATYSSPLERCVQTAQPLAAARQLSVLVAEGVIEVDYGEWRGANLKELAKLPEWKMVQHYPSTFRFPGGETLREVQHRAVTTIEQLRAHHPNQTIAIFSHGDVIRTSLAHYLGTPLDLFQRIAISTASVSVLLFAHGMPTVVGVNCLAELPPFEVKPKDEVKPKEQEQSA